MRKKFVQIAALCLVLACLLTSVGAMPPWGDFDFPLGDYDFPIFDEDEDEYEDEDDYWYEDDHGSVIQTNPEVGNQVIRVGICYGSDAMDGANLENSVGEGFSFGYYDDGYQFTELGYTSKTKISVVKTANVYYGTYNKYTGYHDDITSNIAVGCYHLQLPGEYYSFDDAQWEADYYEEYGAFVAYIQGNYYVRIGNYTKRSSAEDAMYELSYEGIDTEIVGTSSYGVSVVVTGTNTILFQYDDNGSGTGLGIEAVCYSGEKSETWFKDYRWYGGFRYERIDGGDLTVVNMVALDDYVKGVIPYEMSPGWPAEAMKALAVCARNYAVYNSSRHKRYHFSVCNKSCCQVYLGRNRATEETDSYVDETAGVLVYYDGAPIGCWYYASNGGASECSSVVWGSNQTTYPYLLGVIDPFEATVTISGYAWTKEVSPTEMRDLVRGIGYNCSRIVDAYVDEYTETGNPKSVTLVDSNGYEYTLTTRKFVDMLDLRSFRYDFGSGEKPEFSINGTDSVNGLSGLYAMDGNGNLVSVTEGAYVITDQGVAQTSTGNDDVITDNGNIRISGKGWGHNVGLSQQGARAMALQGYTYDEILQFYYTGVTVG